MTIWVLKADTTLIPGLPHEPVIKFFKTKKAAKEYADLWANGIYVIWKESSESAYHARVRKHAMIKARLELLGSDFC